MCAEWNDYDGSIKLYSSSEIIVKAYLHLQRGASMRVPLVSMFPERCVESDTMTFVPRHENARQRDSAGETAVASLIRLLSKARMKPLLPPTATYNLSSQQNGDSRS